MDRSKQSELAGQDSVRNLSAARARQGVSFGNRYVLATALLLVVAAFAIIYFLNF